MALIVLGVLQVLVGCSKKQEVSPAPISGEKSKAGAMLAYEHLLRIRLPGAEIAGRLAATRQACETARFGACNVLRIEQAKHDAELAVRIVPEGVEPMARLAAQGGTVGFRQTTAEDLADAVNDNQRQRELLEKHAQHLAELAARKDIAIADLIALSHEQASVESQLHSLQSVAANQQRRLDTNRLELHFGDTSAYSRSGRIGNGFSGLLDETTEGMTDALRLLGYGLPFLILAFPLALLWLWLWRRFTRRGRMQER
ncbi:DUF4349 domain-containing protein [Rhodanobacter denitrificans]|uniref:DUF4349 domain-containing protein n=1 Tax=Rhodanobacter denitrificans TaxID=666685 RepID=A0A368KGW8_9GAMM|nr:DUF4349 domain-containing protein [Rhodanobacter denitrificans]RCS29923.1 DUF4349 domain-containing protein [Rhodanobacter denitrificans]